MHYLIYKRPRHCAVSCTGEKLVILEHPLVTVIRDPRIEAASADRLVDIV